MKSMAAAGGAWVLAGCGEGDAPETAPAADSAVAAAPSFARDRVGLQLYTVRDQMEKDFTATLERVASIGYDEVEFAGYFDQTPEEVRALLDRLGMTSPSAHVGLAELNRDLPAAIRSAQTVGQRFITIPAVDEAFAGGSLDLAFWRAKAAEFSRIGAAVKAEGLQLAYHNHAFEFVDLGGGTTGWDVLLEETDPELVVFELDLLWAVFAGRDPVAMFQAHPGRYPLWHVKDVRGLEEGKAAVPASPTTMQVIDAAIPRLAAVGTGDIDFRPIFAARETAGLQHFFVENDSAGADGADSLANIETSYRNLSQLLG